MSADGELDLRAELDACRKALGVRSSSFWHSNEAELRLRAPHWLGPADELARVFEEQQRIFVQGRVVLGVVLQSSAVLHQHGDVGGLVAVVHSADPWFEEHPDELVAVANRMLCFVEQDPHDGDERRIASFVREADARATRERVPPGLGEGREVFYATTYAQRSHLPQGWIAGVFLPLLVAPQPRPACAILPARFWPASWRERWSASAPHACQHPSEVCVPGRGIVVVVAYLACDVAVNELADAFTGIDRVWRADHVATDVDLALMGVVLLAAEPLLKRTRRRRVRRTECDHHLDVVRDDRFFRVPVWLWGLVVLGFAIGTTLLRELGGRAA